MFLKIGAEKMRDEEININNEAHFHDTWAESVHIPDVRVLETFNSPTCPENIFIKDQIGCIKGLKLLELGTGLGEGATYFSMQGADVVCTDLSSGMVDLAKRVGKYHGTSFEGAIVDANKLSFQSNSFDIVYGANMLHHVNLSSCLSEVHRVLKPGGRAAFWDPVRYNPIINSYRRMADQVRTDDEHPLGIDDLRMMKSMFSHTKTGYFGLTTLGVFLKFYFVDMIHPNEERYWKKIIVDYDSFHNMYDILRSIDRVILKVPGIKWLAWNMAVVLTK